MEFAMRVIQKRRDLQAVLAAAATLGVALGIVAVLNNLKLQDNSVITVALFLLPLLVYGMASGRLKELRGPGGWMAVFSRMAKETITRRDVLDVDALVVDEQFREPSEADLRRHPNALQITVNSNFNLPICDYLTYIGRLLAAEVVRYAIFVDVSGQFIGIVPLTSITRDKELAPGGDCKAERLIEWIASEESTNLNKIRSLRGFVWRDDAATADWSRRECLEKMIQIGVEALPLLRHERIEGIIEKSQIVNSLIVDLTARLED